MKPAVLADTGPLYAAIDPDDALHTRSREEMNRLARDKREVLVAWPTVLEAYTLLRFRLGAAVASRWLSELLETSFVVNPTPEDYLAAVRLVRKFPDQSITLFDATVSVLAQRMKTEVWTYDHHFDVMRVSVWR